MTANRLIGAVLLLALVSCKRGDAPDALSAPLPQTLNVGTSSGTGGSTAPGVTLSASTTPAVEGTTIPVTVSLSRTASSAVTVPFSVQGVTAGVFDFTFTPTGGSVTIAAGQRTATIEVAVTDDPFKEDPAVETLKVTLGTPSGATLGSPSSVTLQIQDNDTDGLDGTISGRVSSALDGSPLAGVNVVAGGHVGLTDANGHYSIGASPAARIVLAYSKTGYVPTTRVTEQMADATSGAIVNIRMVPFLVTDTFDPTVDHTITVPGSTAQVLVHANTLQTSGGGAPVGNVTAYVTPLALATDPSLLPGNYRTSNGPPVASFESFGALDFTAIDSASNALTMVPTTVLDERIPVSTRASSPPASASARTYDPATGLWGGSGVNTATLAGTAPSQYYSASVTDVGTWSAAASYATVVITGCIVDPTGSRVPNATVIAEGIGYTGTTQVQSDANGVFEVPVKQGAQAFISANKRTGVSNSVSVTRSAADTLSECLLLVPGAASIRLTWGANPHDLDSHTLGPNQNDHTWYGGPGSLTTPPFVGLDVDDVTGFGPEITTIIKAAKSRTYSFYVRNFSQTFSPGQTGSPARVELYIKGEQTVFTPPVGEGSTNVTWHVFDMTSDANCDLTLVTPLPATPWSTLSDSALDNPANNPNPDNSAVFCN